MIARKVGPAFALVLAMTLAPACSRDPEIAKREYLASGDKYFAEGKVKEAILEYRNAVNQDERFGEARYKLAEAYVKDGNLAAALAEYVRAADLLPDDNQAQLKAGNLLLLSGRHQDARTRASNVLQRDPKNVEAQVLFANALAGLKDLEGAIDEIQKAIELDPGKSGTYASLGVMEHARGSLAEAETAFIKATEVDPKSVMARLALANFYWATRKPDDAGRVLLAAYEIDPSQLLTNRMLALYQMARGKPADAEPYLKKVAELTKDSSGKLALADYYLFTNRRKDALPILEGLVADPANRTAAELRLAGLDFDEKRREEAHKRVDGILQREGKNVPALVLKGRFLATEGKVDDAIQQFVAATSADPRSAEAHYRLGEAYLVKRDRENAIKAFNETLRLNPRATVAQLHLSRLELASGNPDASIQLAEQVLKNAPASPDAKVALIRALVARRDLRRAEAELQPLLKQYPNNPTVHVLAGTISAARDDRSQTLAAFNRAQELDANNLEATAALASLDFAAKKPADAVARVEARLARTPNDTAVLLLASATYARAGDSRKAEQSLRKVLELDANNFQAYQMLGQLYVAQNRLDEALKEFDEVSKRRPRPVMAHTLVGILHEMGNRKAEARKRYEQALAIDSETPVAANNLAWLMAEAGDNLDVALALAQKAGRRLPDSPAVQDTLGWIYYKKGLPTLAVPPFQKSVEKDPKNPVYHFHLGLAYAKAGDQKRARVALQQSLTLAPDFAGADEAKKVLAAL